MFTLPPHHPLCASMFGGHLMVPNSKEEAIFIGNYLAGVQVFLILDFRFQKANLGISHFLNLLFSFTYYVA